jgi:hypothetical protein
MYCVPQQKSTFVLKDSMRQVVMAKSNQVFSLFVLVAGCKQIFVALTFDVYGSSKYGSLFD